METLRGTQGSSIQRKRSSGAAKRARARILRAATDAADPSNSNYVKSSSVGKNNSNEPRKGMNPSGPSNGGRINTNDSRRGTNPPGPSSSGRNNPNAPRKAMNPPGPKNGPSAKDQKRMPNDRGITNQAFELVRQKLVATLMQVLPQTNASGNWNNNNQRALVPYNANNNLLKMLADWCSNNNMNQVSSDLMRAWDSSTNRNNAGPSNMGLSNMGTSNMGPSNMGPSNMGPSNRGPSNRGSSNMGSSNMGSSNMGPSNRGSSNMGLSNMGPSNMGPSNPQSGWNSQSGWNNSFGSNKMNHNGPNVQSTGFNSSSQNFNSFSAEWNDPCPAPPVWGNGNQSTVKNAGSSTSMWNDNPRNAGGPNFYEQEQAGGMGDYFDQSNNAAYDESPDELKFAIMDMNMPNGKITGKRQELLKNAFNKALAEVILKADSRFPPIQIKFSRFIMDTYKISVASRRCAEVLQNLVDNLPSLWPGSNLRLVPAKGRVKLTKASIYLRSGGIDRKSEDIFLILERQNAGLSTRNWHVFYRKERDDAVLLIVGIDQQTIDYLDRTNGRVFYLTSNAFFRIGKDIGGGKKNKKKKFDGRGENSN